MPASPRPVPPHSRFEVSARARKVAALVEVLDGDLQKAGHSLCLDAAIFAASLSISPPSAWDELARRAGVPFPSEQTREQVVQVYASRAAHRVFGLRAVG